MNRAFVLACLLLVTWIVAGCGTEPRRVLVPRAATDTPALTRTLESAGAVGPRICFSSEIVDYCFPDGGYCLCETGVVPADIPAGRTLTMSWHADPQPGTSVRWYRWSVDIEDVLDETPRINEATDLAHWSQRSATPLSAQLGPWNQGEVHYFRLEVEDDLGLRSLGSIRFTVGAAANRPPDCAAAAPDRAMLWPADHGLVAVSIQGVSDPDGDPVTIQVTRVSQDETPIDGRFDVAGAGESGADAWAVTANSTIDAGGGPGGSRTCPDAEIQSGGQVMLRAERSARGDGRVYTVWFTATDPSGASCDGSVRVCVPRSGHADCADGGPLFDSLGPCAVP